MVKILRGNPVQPACLGFQAAVVGVHILEVPDAVTASISSSAPIGIGLSFTSTTGIEAADCASAAMPLAATEPALHRRGLRPGREKTHKPWNDHGRFMNQPRD